MMKIVKEVILPGIELRQIYRDGLTRTHDAFAVQLEALELDRRGILVGHVEFERLVRGDLE